MGKNKSEHHFWQQQSCYHDLPNIKINYEF